MGKLHDAICKQQNSHPESLFIAAGDFNHANLKTVLPKFYNNVKINTRNNKTLDQVYRNIPRAYKSLHLILDSLTIYPCSSHQPTNPSFAEPNLKSRQCRAGPQKLPWPYRTALRTPGGSFLGTLTVSAIHPQSYLTSVSALTLLHQRERSKCSLTRSPGSKAG